MRPEQLDDARRRNAWAAVWPWVAFVPLGVMTLVVALALLDRPAFDRLAYYAGVSWGQLPFYDAFAPLSWFECAQKGVDITRSNPCDVRSTQQLAMSYPPAWLWFNVNGLDTGQTDAVGLSWGALLLLSLAFLPRPRSAAEAAAFLLAGLSHAVLFALYQANFDLVIFAGLVLALRLALRGGPERLGAYAGLTFLAVMKIYPLVGLVLLLRERLRVILGVTALAVAFLVVHVAQNIDGWRLSVAMIHSRSTINMFGVGNLARGLPVLWGVGGEGGWAIPLAYVSAVGLAGAVAVWTAQQMVRHEALHRLSELQAACALLFGAVILFCFFAAQNYMYRAIFLVPLLPILAALMCDSATAPLRWIFGLAIMALLGCLWGGYFLSAVDHVQKAIHGTTEPPANVIRALAWTLREACWWFSMSMVAALLVGVAWRMPTVTLLAGAAWRKRGLK